MVKEYFVLITSAVLFVFCFRAALLLAEEGTEGLCIFFTLASGLFGFLAAVGVALIT